MKFNSSKKLVAILWCLGFILFRPAHVPAFSGLQVNVEVIQADRSSTVIDPELKDLVTELSPVLNYSGFSLIKKSEIRLKPDEKGEVLLSSGRMLEFQFLGFEDKKARLLVRIVEKGQETFRTILLLVNKGSIIIEAGGEVPAADRGVTDYHHPEVSLIGMASRHNLVYPESADGRLMRQPRDRFGGKLTSAVWERGILLACSDNAEAWESGLFTCNYRRVYSPAPDLILIDDELVMSVPMAVSFLINTLLPVVTDADGATVQGTRYGLRIVPLNWSADEINAEEEGVDSHLKPATVIRLKTGVASSHRLVTLLAIHKMGAPDTFEAVRGDRPTVTGTQGSVTIDARESQALTAILRRPSGAPITSRCDGGVWT